MNTYLTVYFGAMLVAILLVPLVSRLAKHYSLVDEPGPRKVHEVAIPRVGGIAFVLATLALVVPVFYLENTVGQAFRDNYTKLVVLLAGAAFVFVVGLIDDVRGLSGYTKLICLVGVSLVLCGYGIKMNAIGLSESFVLEMGWTAWPATVLWIVMITVCMNLIDGLDGLAAGVAVIVCGIIVLLALWSSQTAMAVLMLALLGGVTGFLFFNFYPAKIFMGDGGSMFLGFMIGAGSLVCQMKTSALIGLAVPFLVMGAPILDAGMVVAYRRLVERRSVFAPDRNHLHHRLLTLGLHHRAVVAVMYAITAICASVGVYMMTAEGQWSSYMLAGAVALLCTVFACLRGGRLLKMAKGLRRNLAIARAARADKHSFERSQVKMEQVKSVQGWWEMLCEMAGQMHFQRLGIWKRENGSYVPKFEWNATSESSGICDTAQIGLPIGGNGMPHWQLRATINAEGGLEECGRRAMLLGRLIDEFAPPESESALTKGGVGGESRLLLDDKVGRTGNRELREHLPAPVEVMGVPVTPFESYEQALQCAEKIIASNCKSMWLAINPVKVYHSWKNPELREILEQADVRICDGVGVSMASKILKGHGINRCTGCDLFFQLLSRAAEKGWGVYLLGASAESNEAARKRLQGKYKGLKIVGWHDGYFQESQPVLDEINASEAKMLFVAMGSPRQEQWIQSHREAINANICMGVGGSFDVAAGTLKRAPKIFRMTGTEFLYRLSREPRKRWRIQKVLLPYFANVMGKKAADLTLADESQEELDKEGVK